MVGTHARRGKSIKTIYYGHSMPTNTTHWDSAEYLKIEEDVQLYLEACLEEAGDDPAFIAHALDVIARVRNMNQLANIKPS